MGDAEMSQQVLKSAVINLSGSTEQLSGLPTLAVARRHPRIQASCVQSHRSTFWMSAQAEFFVM